MAWSSPKYEDFLSRLREIARLSEIMGLLGWDQETMMPKGATESRAQQKALLAGLLHDRVIDPAFGELGAAIKAEYTRAGEKDPYVEANLREFFRSYERTTKVPKALVEALEEAETHAHEIWVAAREASDFARFAPHLATLLRLRREESQAIDEKRPAYDVQMERYEVGLGNAAVEKIFGPLKTGLRPLLDSILGAAKKPSQKILQGQFAIEKQRQLGLEVIRAMGFDFNHGRIDVSVHPFCGGPGGSDIRMTTRYDEADFCDSLFAVIHETGHALYEQGLDPAHRDEPAADSRSMGVHESQSLFWEKRIGLSRGFWEGYFPKLQVAFPSSFAATPFTAFYDALHVVEPSLIRVNADEVTYPLHIILRFELEVGLFSGSLSPADLPAAWNEKMKAYLGITPPDDRTGVLQDVHWSLGAFGYFPTYILGAIYGSQLFRACQQALPDLERETARGNFLPIKEWLNREVHQRGRLLETPDLIRTITGQTIDPAIHLTLLWEKYGAVYGVER